MGITPTAAATATDSRRARKMAARKEREVKHREAKTQAKAAEERDPAPARKRHRVPLSVSARRSSLKGQSQWLIE